jgi:hypothetical protein
MYVWWADECEVLAGTAIWDSIDVRAEHNTAVLDRPAWHFGGNCSEWTAYTNLLIVGDEATTTELLLTYDKTHIEVPKTVPKGDEVNYIFSTRLHFTQ